MSASRIGTLVRLELLQRLRSVSWYVLLGIYVVVLAIVTTLAFLAFGGFRALADDATGAGSAVYSTIVYIVLLLAVLVSPTLSGNTINGDRDASTLAPVQVTLATTGDIVVGKFLAAWATGAVFAVVAVPFLVIATFAGGVHPLTVLVSLVILLAEIGIIAAIGVGFSGILARPLFSVAATYLVVAALAVGTLIGFGLGGASIQSEVTYSYRSVEYDDQGMPECVDGSDDCWDDPASGGGVVCGEWTTERYTVPRFDAVWWMLAANPFVVLADATPTSYDESGNPDDVFGYVKLGVRQAQIPPETEQQGWDDCAPYMDEPYDSGPTAREVIESTVPSWFVGLALQIVLAAALLWGALARTRTPARRLPPGTRIA